MRLGEDYDLYARALACGARMRLIPWTGYVSVLRLAGLSSQHNRADLVALEAADERLLASPELGPEEKSLVERHRFTTRSRIVWIDFMDTLKSGRPFRALSIVLQDPRQAPHVIRGLWKAVVRRLAGRARGIE
jgi:succinoglycan biosynthesis protein ExoU